MTASASSGCSRSTTAMNTALATASTNPVTASASVPGRAVSPTARPANAGRIDSAATVIAIIDTAVPRRSAAAYEVIPITTNSAPTVLAAGPSCVSRGIEAHAPKDTPAITASADDDCARADDTVERERDDEQRQSAETDHDQRDTQRRVRSPARHSRRAARGRRPSP